MNIELITHQLAGTYYQQLIDLNYNIRTRDTTAEPIPKEEAAMIKSLWSMIRSCRSEAKAFGNTDLNIVWPPEIPITPLPPKEEKNNPQKNGKDTTVKVKPEEPVIEDNANYYAPAPMADVVESDTDTIAAAEQAETNERIIPDRRPPEQKKLSDAVIWQMVHNSNRRRHSY
jgi:hypothetical protein